MDDCEGVIPRMFILALTVLMVGLVADLVTAKNRNIIRTCTYLLEINVKSY